MVGKNEILIVFGEAKQVLFYALPQAGRRANICVHTNLGTTPGEGRASDAAAPSLAALAHVFRYTVFPCVLFLLAGTRVLITRAVRLPLVPCYALTVHKTQANSLLLFHLSCCARSQMLRARASSLQALSIRHLVLGCLEGVFAQGHVYVLVSRVTDPACTGNLYTIIKIWKGKTLGIRFSYNKFRSGKCIPKHFVTQTISIVCRFRR